MEYKHLVLFSGGLDSTATLCLACQTQEKVLALFMNYGQGSLNKELSASRNVVFKLRDLGYNVDFRAINVPSLYTNVVNGQPYDKPIFVGESGVLDNHVPMRNLTLTSLALAHCELMKIPNLWVGYGYEREGDVVSWDSSYLFVDHMQSTLDWKHNLHLTEDFIHTNNAVTPKLISPMYKANRKTWLTYIAESFEPVLKLSWSCYLNKNNHCGTCSSCRNRNFLIPTLGVTNEQTTC